MPESFATPPFGERNARHASRSPVSCPRCGSLKTQTMNRAQKLGGAFGACVGVVSTLSGAAKGAAVGAAMGFRVAAPITPLSGVAAAVLGALAGGVMGCTSGAALGQVIDDTVLNNHLCLHCNHSFPTQ